MKADHGLSATPSPRLSNSALFFSDTHLFHCRNGAGHHHLKTIHASRATQIYAVGDTFDLEAVDDTLERAGVPWQKFPRDFVDVLNAINFPALEYHVRLMDVLADKAARGVEVTLITGNHDLALDALDGREIAGIKIRRDALYDAGGGSRFLVEHGHLLDPGFLRDYQGWYKIGSWFLNRGLEADHALQAMSRHFKHRYHCSNALKKIGKSYVHGYVDRAMEKAKAACAQGIICGHIHKQDYIDTLHRPLTGRLTKRVQNSGVAYINCGDGLTHGTSVVHDGQWHLYGPEVVPGSAMLEQTNPLIKHRNTSFDILQTIWDAHLARKSWAEAAKEREAAHAAAPDLLIPVSAMSQLPPHRHPAT